MPARRGPAWSGSTRSSRLPAKWDQLRREADRLNPNRTCHVCGRPGGDELDHIVPGDDHSQNNLAWIHNDPCHRQKSSREGAAARPRLYRDPEQHPAL
jgi:5-methylcytosine-specific restriction protein A